MGVWISKQETTHEGGSNNLSEQAITFVVQNIGPNLRQLGRQLGLSETQLTELEQSKESLEERAHKMIDWWIRKKGRKATTRSMVKALKQIERNDLADELMDSTVLVTGHDKLTDFSKLQQRLANRYSRYCIPQPPNINKILSFEEIFIHQQMEMTVKNSQHKTKLVQLKDIFQPTNKQPLTRILIEGDPGFGKTTLAFKLANDWANGEDYIASKFHLVMLIPLGEVQDQKIEDVILGIIQRAVDKMTITSQDLKCYLDQHKVFLILDGYDETTVKCRSYLRDMLEKKAFESACILVTSRRGIFTNEECMKPSTSLVLFEKDDKVGCELWDKRIQLKGFTKQQRQQLLKVNFEIKPEAMESTEEMLSVEMFECPLFVFWLGWVLEKYPMDQIKTNTGFYKALVNLILHKTLVREKKIKEADTFDIFGPANGEISILKQEVHHFGKIALEQLIQHNLMFTEENLKDLSGSMLIVSDLLVRFKCLIQREEETLYQPMHKSFMEFLAAFSISCSVENEQISFYEFEIKIKMIHDKLGLSYHAISTSSLFFPFLAGLMEQRAHWLFDVLSSYPFDYKICQIKMIEILVEITHFNNKIIDSLIKLTPSYYDIRFPNALQKSFFLSDLHKRIFQISVEKKLIKELMCDHSFLFSLPVERIEVDTILLTASNEDIDKIIFTTSIHCKELKLNIYKYMTPSSWDSYSTMISKINATCYYLDVGEWINPSTCTMIFNELQQGRWKHLSFQWVSIKFTLNFFHIEVLVEIVKKNRIKTKLSLAMINHRGCLSAMIPLWKAVFQSPSIDELNHERFNLESNRFFDFSLISDIDTKFILNITIFGCEFIMNHSKLRCFQTRKSIFSNLTKKNAKGAKKLLRNYRNVREFECDNDLFSLCRSNNIPLLPSVTGLSLTVRNEDDFFQFPSSAVDQLVSLEALTLNVCLLSSACPLQCVNDFVVAILNSRKLRVLEFDGIESRDILVKLMDIMSKVKQNVDLFCLTLDIYYAPIYSSDLLKELLRQNRMKRVAIEDKESICSILPVLFPEEEFLLKHGIGKYKAMNFILDEEKHKMNTKYTVIELKTPDSAGK